MSGNAKYASPRHASSNGKTKRIRQSRAEESARRRRIENGEEPIYRCKWCAEPRMTTARHNCKATRRAEKTLAQLIAGEI